MPVRELLYVPVIHTDSDLGSAAPALEQRSASFFGEQRWARHKAMVALFWQQVTHYVHSIPAANLKIYQDGLLAGGDLGKKIIEEGAHRGSPNYIIILALMKRGAEIRPTEDASLLKEEYEHLRRLAQAPSSDKRPAAYEEYELRKDGLRDERDRFVAQAINKSLQEGEMGLLFMGAYHRVLPYLDKDIVVRPLKEPDKVRAYFEGLTQGKNEEELGPLAEYLASPIAQ
ncbi:MAG: hypothetical protein Q8O76_00785 [Chloroflexota bacterium]|nr:hypothetical protein [Chloroflexota bacterium]